MYHSVMFVCLGNICRSPTAEAVFRNWLHRKNCPESIRLASSGTGDWHIGRGADQRATMTARNRGIDLSNHLAQQLRPEHFMQFHWMIAMDRRNLADMQSLHPDNHQNSLHMLMDFVPGQEGSDVPDPYFGRYNGFEEVLDLCNAACQGLYDAITRKMDAQSR